MKELVYHRFLLPALDSFAPQVAFRDGEHQVSFSTHGSRVLRLADAMAGQLGLGAGARFAIMSLNCHEVVELFHAAYLGAGVAVPLNVRLSPHELRHVVRHSGVTVAFVDAAFGPRLLEAIEPIRDDLELRHVVLMGDGEVACDVRYDALLEAGREVVPAEPEETDPALLMYTGGTTGLPKGVLSDQRAAVLNLLHCGIRGRTGYTAGSVYLHHVPLFHISGLTSVLAAPAFGAESVVLSHFEAGRVIEVIEQYGVNETPMVPTMIAMVLDHPTFRPERLASLRRLGYGAAPMPAALLDRVRRLLPGVGLVQGYGMTECAVLTILEPEEHERPHLLRSVGRPVPGVVVSIRDLDGNPVPAGREGEICVRSGSVMQEYWNDRDATAEAFRGDWFHTGDAGRLDDEGYLYIVDRVKDMIITGGENVFSLEVEDAIASHPAVAQVAVIGVPHDTWGEQVHAVVVVRPGVSVTEEEIVDHARGTVAGYKVPRSVELRREPLPMSAAMKPLKRELRAAWLEAHGG